MNTIRWWIGLAIFSTAALALGQKPGVAEDGPGALLATEICNGINDDGDLLTDEFCDDDNDDYCDAGMGYSGSPPICPNGPGDLNDSDPLTYPGALELCDGRDNDCDGSVDDGCANSVGQVVSDPTIHVSDPAFNSGNTRVVGNGPGYALVWQETHTGGVRVQFGLLDAGGNRLPIADPEPDGTDDDAVTVSPAGGNVPDLVWTGYEYGVVWQLSSGQIWFSRLYQWGWEVPGSELQVSHTTATAYYPKLVWTGHQYGMAWVDNRSGHRQIYFARLESDGTLVAGSEQMIVDAPDIALEVFLSSGIDGYGLAWYTGSSPNGSLHFQRLDRSGTPLSSPVLVASGTDVNFRAADIVFTGHSYAISFGMEKNPYLARIDASTGSVISLPDPEPDGVNDDCARLYDGFGYSIQTAVTWTGTNYGVVFLQEPWVGSLYLHLVTLQDDASLTRNSIADPEADGQDDDALDLAFPGGHQGSTPDLVWTGSALGGFWESWEGGSNNQIHLRQVQLCSDVDGDGFNPCSAGPENPQGGDCNDVDANVFPGANENCNGIDDDCDGTIDEGCSTTLDNPQDSGPHTNFGLVTEWESRADIVWAPQRDRWGVVWDVQEPGNYMYLYFAEFGRDGALAFGPVRLTTCDGLADCMEGLDYRPAISWNGQIYAVGWFYDYGHGGMREKFGLLAPGSTALTAVRIVSYSDEPETMAGNSRLRARVLWTGSDWAMVWNGYLDSDLDGTVAEFEQEIHFAYPERGVDRIVKERAHFPDLDWTGGRFGLSYNSSLSNPSMEAVLLLLLDSAGVPLGIETGFGIVGPDAYSNIVWSGEVHAIARHRNLSGGDAFLETAGEDATWLAENLIMDDGGETDVAWTGTEFGLVTPKPPSFFVPPTDLWFHRHDAAGNQLYGEVQINAGSVNLEYAQLAWNGECFGIVATRDHSHMPPEHDMFFTRVCNCGNWDPIPGDEYNACAYDPVTNPMGGDCNENDPTVHPGATELADGVDNDCDGTIDEDTDRTFQRPVRVFDRALGDVMGRPRVARAGWFYAAVWQDLSGAVLLARITSTGQILDDPPFLVSDSGRQGFDPDVAWSGSNLAVVWQDLLPGSEESRGIEMRVFDSNLTLMGRTSFAPSGDGVSPGYEPSIAWAGDRWVTSFTWVVSCAGEGIWLARHTANAQQIGALEGIWSGNQSGVAWNGQWVGIAFRSWGDECTSNCIRLARRKPVPESNPLVPVKVNATNDTCDLPAIAPSNTGWGISYHDVRWYKNWTFFRAMSSALTAESGEMMSGSENSIRSSLDWTGVEFGHVNDWFKTYPSGEIQYWSFDKTTGRHDGYNLSQTSSVASTGPDIAYAWQEHGAVWNEGGVVHFGLIRSLDYCTDDDLDGFNVCPPDAVANPAGGDCNDQNPAIHPGAPEVKNGEDDNCDMEIDEGFDTGVPFPEEVLDVYLGDGSGPATADDHKGLPAVAWGGTQWGVAWEDTGRGIWFALLTPDGEMKTGFPRLLNDPMSDPAASPDISWNGRDFGVIFKDLNMVGGTRLILVDAAGSTAGDVRYNKRCGGLPRIAWGRDRFAVTCSRLPGGSDPSTVLLSRLSPAGIEMVPDEEIGPGDQPTVTWNGVRFGISYRDGNHVWLTERDPILGGSFPVTLVDDISYVSSLPSLAPRRVAGRDGFFVCWRTILWYKDWVFCRPFEGSPLAPAGTIRLAGAEASVISSIAWTGSEYSLANDNHLYSTPYDVHWRRLDHIGQRFDGNPTFPVINLSNSPGVQSRVPDVAWNGNRACVTWEEWNGSRSTWEVRFACVQSLCADEDADVYNGCPYMQTGNPYGGDCNDSDPDTWREPVEVSGFSVARGEVGVELAWDSQDSSAGPATHYDLVTGNVADFRGTSGYNDAMCLASNVPDTPFTDDRVGPRPGEAAYFLVRAANSCRTGTYGDSTESPDPRDALDATGPCP